MVYKRLITKSSLKRRGWTDGMIKQFFNKPTQVVPNPHYPTSYPMKLYSITQVKRIERGTEFLEYARRVANQREIARNMMIERHKNAKQLVLVPHNISVSNQRA